MSSDDLLHGLAIQDMGVNFIANLAWKPGEQRH
jgi:hypothetical protein